MLVYLLRHGRAEGAGPTRTDAERALTEGGARQLEATMASYAQLLSRPSRILHSPFLRARQTAEMLAMALGFSGSLEPTPKLFSEADPGAMLADLEGAVSSGAEVVALVGHEPFLGRMLALLLTGDTGAAIPMKTGMLAVVDIEAPISMVGRLVFVRAP